MNNMKHVELLRRIEEHEVAEVQRKSAALRVWVAFSEDEPDFAHEVLQLFSTVEAAAQWFVSPHMPRGLSPARDVAEGRAAEVMTRVRRTAYGFAG